MEIPFWVLVAVGIIINTYVIWFVTKVIILMNDHRVKSITITSFALVMVALFVFYWCFVFLS